MRIFETPPSAEAVSVARAGRAVAEKRTETATSAADRRIMSASFFVVANGEMSDRG
jgi:hypothetical protein